MIDKFELLLDLLDIEDKNTYIEVAKKIESKKYKKVKTLHKHGFIFEVFNDFVDGKIALESFVRLWDLESWIDISQIWFDLDILLSWEADLSDTLFVVSMVDLWRKFWKKEIEEIKQKISAVNSELCVI